MGGGCARGNLGCWETGVKAQKTGGRSYPRRARYQEGPMHKHDGELNYVKGAGKKRVPEEGAKVQRWRNTMGTHSYT